MEMSSTRVPVTEDIERRVAGTEPEIDSSTEYLNLSSSQFNEDNCAFEIQAPSAMFNADMKEFLGHNELNESRQLLENSATDHGHDCEQLLLQQWHCSLYGITEKTKNKVQDYSSLTSFIGQCVKHEVPYEISRKETSSNVSCELKLCLSADDESLLFDDDVDTEHVGDLQTSFQEEISHNTLLNPQSCSQKEVKCENQSPLSQLTNSNSNLILPKEEDLTNCFEKESLKLRESLTELPTNLSASSALGAPSFKSMKVLFDSLEKNYSNDGNILEILPNLQGCKDVIQDENENYVSVEDATAIDLMRQLSDKIESVISAEDAETEHKNESFVDDSLQESFLGLSLIEVEEESPRKSQEKSSGHEATTAPDESNEERDDELRRVNVNECIEHQEEKVAHKDANIEENSMKNASKSPSETGFYVEEQLPVSIHDTSNCVEPTSVNLNRVNDLRKESSMGLEVLYDSMTSLEPRLEKEKKLSALQQKSYPESGVNSDTVERSTESNEKPLNDVESAAAATVKEPFDTMPTPPWTKALEDFVLDGENAVKSLLSKCLILDSQSSTHKNVNQSRLSIPVVNKLDTISNSNKSSNLLPPTPITDKTETLEINSIGPNGQGERPPQVDVPEIKGYMLPFVSSDPLENRDNEDPRWDILRSITSDEERVKKIRELWGNVTTPDPNTDLTRHARWIFYNACMSRDGKVRGMTGATKLSVLLALLKQKLCTGRKRARDHANDCDVAMPPTKRQRISAVSDLSFLQEKTLQVERVLQHNYNCFLRSADSAIKKRRLSEDLDKKIKHVIYGFSEMERIHLFYSGVSRNEDNRREIEEQEVVYNAFKKYYNWQGNEFCTIII
ncbi:uncharacterized protein LOC108665968 isoform X2 [Hyalella azteca]|uniref:Uncharacterized protein LOC108665968 isoform X1 n=1 Tax=Hyalella azteca TaxID=294128 RepID=A0A8B7N4J2_HYAAZ|nr:uncharacterized protein LOC108665968 isoform X1 [Hyalella azteca]XP_047741684.1 uncharacterized protein LOC108665968 isoform X2 [Hyalella azteca]